MWRHLKSILLLPFVAVVGVPAALLLLVGIESGLSSCRSLASAAGCLFISGGLTLMVLCITLFARQGQGTLAPWDPPKRLVVRGVYRHVRNPMMTGVLCILLGESLLFFSLPLAVWFAAFAAAHLAYIPLVEEPGLERRFGEEYAAYKRNVPRWIPRLKPWRPSRAAGR